MKLFLTLALLVVACATIAVAGGKGDHFKCKGKQGDFSSVKDKWESCKDEGKGMCKKVCMWEASGVVTNNQMDATAFSNQIKTFFGDEVGTNLASALAVCLEGDNIKDLSKDDNCKSYGKLGKCLKDTWKENCKE